MSTEPKPLTAFQQTYHWRNKNCGPWAQNWVKQTLPGTKINDGAQSAELTEVTSVSGDCDLGQRKGKLLTIYDLEVEVKWKGITKAGDEVTGKLKVPEFSHEAIDGLSDYVFDFSLDSDSSADADALLRYARSAFPPVLIETFNSFRPALLTAHGIFIDGTPSESGASTPATGPASTSYSPAPPGEQHVAAVAAAAAAAQPKPVASKVTKTATVETSAMMQASADDIWALLTDESRVPLWSRSQAKISPTPGTEYQLFGGNVTGKIITADRPIKLVQTWQTKSPGWPSDHFGTMTITLVQGSDSTNLSFSLEGVPAGKESEIERALDTFYIRGLKQMGLGTIL